MVEGPRFGSQPDDGLSTWDCQQKHEGHFRARQRQKNEGHFRAPQRGIELFGRFPSTGQVFLFWLPFDTIPKKRVACWFLVLPCVRVGDRPPPPPEKGTRHPPQDTKAGWPGRPRDSSRKAPKRSALLPWQRLGRHFLGGGWGWSSSLIGCLWTDHGFILCVCVLQRTRRTPFFNPEFQRRWFQAPTSEPPNSKLYPVTPKRAVAMLKSELNS